MQDDPQQPNDAPFEDPFQDHLQDDPEVQDVFGQRERPKGNRSEPLPDASAVLILGILSILGGFCYGVTGVILGVVALVMCTKPERLYLLEPSRYNLNSYNNLKAGKVCAIIGLCMSLIMSFFFLLVALGMGQ